MNPGWVFSFCSCSTLGLMMRPPSERVGAAPAPVAFRAPGLVHARFVAEIEDVLQRGDRQRGGGRPRESEQGRCDPLAGARRALQVAPQIAPLGLRQAVVPLS